jgi:hypothetical protein
VQQAYVMLLQHHFWRAAHAFISFVSVVRLVELHAGDLDARCWKYGLHFLCLLCA